MAMEFTIRYGTLISLPLLDLADVLDAAGIRWMSMIVFDHQQHGTSAFPRGGN
jgi:hypothetical protein